MNNPVEPTVSYALADLCILADIPVRTLRYYVQKGLVSRPEGETRAAKYSARHLEQVLLIKKWTAAGVSLERIHELLHGGTPSVEARLPSTGSVSVRSHIHINEGIELVIDPGRAGFSPEQVRHFITAVMAALKDGRANAAAPDSQAGHELTGENDNA